MLKLITKIRILQQINIEKQHGFHTGIPAAFLFSAHSIEREYIYDQLNKKKADSECISDVSHSCAKRYDQHKYDQSSAQYLPPSLNTRKAQNIIKNILDFSYI